MGNKRITDLTPITIPTGLDVFPLVHQGAVRQINLDNLFTYVDTHYFKSGKAPAVTDSLGYNYNQFKDISGNFIVSGGDIVRVSNKSFRVDHSGYFETFLSGRNVYIDNLSVSGLSLSGGAIQGDLTILGNLRVSGDVTSLSTDFEIEDKNITFASVPTGLLDNVGLDGAGFTVKGLDSDKHITWYNSDGGTWQVDQNFEIEGKSRTTGTATFNSGVYITNSNGDNPLKLGPNINLYASGTSSSILSLDQNLFVRKNVTIADNLYVQDNLDVSGNQIRLLGDVTLGTSASNNITFLGGFVQDVKPVNDWANEASTPYQALGINNKRWKELYAGKGIFHDSVNVTGNVRITGDLFVTGSSFIGDGEQDNLDVKATPVFRSTNSIFENNVNISGNLNVGDSNSKNLSVNSTVYLNNGNLFVKNNSKISGNLEVSGNVVLGDNLSNTLIVNSTPVLKSSKNYILNDINVGQNLKISGAVEIGSDSNVVLNTSSSALNVYKNTNINGELVITGDVKISGAHDLFVNRSGYFDQGIKVGNNTVLITPNLITIDGDPLIVRTNFLDLSGQLISLSGDVLDSGNSLITQLYSVSGNLGSTGNSLITQLLTLSGNVESSGNNLAINLASTGDNLNIKTNTLSGYTESNFLKNNYPNNFGTGIVNGLVSAYGFIGSGDGLYNLDASKIAIGTLDNSRLNVANFTGDFYFPGDISIRNLSVFGTGFITNTEISNISNNFLTLNATGEGLIGNEGGIYIITGSNATGYYDTGAIIAWDKHTNRWHFGIFSRSEDLSNVAPIIASLTEVQIASGDVRTFVIDNYVTRNSNQTITGLKEFVTEVISPNLVYNSGNQIISGIKTFDSRPIYNGEGLVIASDLANQNNIVFVTGDQTISGIKAFESRPTVNGTGVLLQNEATRLDNVVFQTGAQYISGQKDFEFVPMVNGVPIVVSGSGLSLSIQTQDVTIPNGSIQTDINFINSYATGIKPVVIGNLYSTGVNEEVIPFQLQNINHTGFRISIAYPVTGYNFSFISFQRTGLNFIAQGPAGTVYNRKIQLDTGVASQLITFETPFSSLPTVNLQLEDRNNPPTEDFLLHRITGLSTNGFFVHLSQPIPAANTGYYLHVTANI